MQRHATRRGPGGSSSRWRRVPVRTQVTTYPLEAVDKALAGLRAGRLTGVGVIVP